MKPMAGMEPTVESLRRNRNEQDGRVSGRIGKPFSPNRPDRVCEHCMDERKDRPIAGKTNLKGSKAWIREQ